MNGQTKLRIVQSNAALAALFFLITALSSIGLLTETIEPKVVVVCGVLFATLLLTSFAGLFWWLPEGHRRSALLAMRGFETASLSVPSNFQRLPDEVVLIPRATGLIRSEASSYYSAGDIIVTNRRIACGLTNRVIGTERFGAYNIWGPQTRDIPSIAKNMMSKIFDMNITMTSIGSCVTQPEPTSETSVLECARITVDHSPLGTSLLLYHPQAARIVEIFSGPQNAAPISSSG